jgi:hypothetical protein
VTQLGAVVLAITRRRSLRRDEYPRSTNDLATSTTVSANPSIDSKLRAWLQDALLVHGRVVFTSAVDAARAFRDIVPGSPGRAVETLAIQTAIRQLCGEPEIPAEPAESAARTKSRKSTSQLAQTADLAPHVGWAAPPAAAEASFDDSLDDSVEESTGSAERTFTFLRSLLPHVRAS